MKKAQQSSAIEQETIQQYNPKEDAKSKGNNAIKTNGLWQMDQNEAFPENNSPWLKYNFKQISILPKSPKSNWPKLKIKTPREKPNVVSSEFRIYPKLRISQPDDIYEQEANRAADEVLRMNPDELEEKGKESIVRREHRNNNSSTPSGLSSMELGSGRSLDPSIRSYFEPRFGISFGDVRIHTGDHAAESSKSIEARAYTLGKNIVFGEGEYQPFSGAGRQLLAHELAHVALHDTSIIRRHPFETKGIPLNRGDIAIQQGLGYWEQRTANTYATTFDRRMNSNAEERDAVLSTFWGLNPPAQVTRERLMVIPIVARTLPATGQTASQQAPALLYRIILRPPAAARQKPRVEFQFVSSGAGALPIVAPNPPASFQPSQPNFATPINFPSSGNQPWDYFAAYPEEHKALFHWMENLAPASFDQVITTKTHGQGRRRNTVIHRSVIRVRGRKTANRLSHLRFTLASESQVGAQQTAPANYRGRGRGIDFELEQLQATRLSRRNRLGTVTIPPAVPANELVPVKYAIYQYFKFGNARNTEVDAIIPVGTAAQTVLYSLVFGSNNNVRVTRVGEAGTGAGQVNVQRIDVNRINGFPGGSATPAVLRAWWVARYPQGGTLTPAPPTPAQGQGPTVTPISSATLIADMNRLITTGITNRNWFQQNYGIEVLDSAGTANRLQNIHFVPTNMITDTTNFSAVDLINLEISLQTLNDHEIVLLQGVKLGRKTSAITRRRIRRGWTYRSGSASSYGITFTETSGTNRESTVLYFQPLYANNDRLFRGNTAANALPDVSMGILHELGHALSFGSIERSFLAWLGRNRQTAPTWYAASKQSEFFPETFALYHTDPHFLCNSAPLLYAWFDILATTGSPPSPTSRLTAPTNCP